MVWGTGESLCHGVLWHLKVILWKLMEAGIWTIRKTGIQ